MKNIQIDFSGIKNEEDVYAVLKKQLELPDYFGNNLDALYDMLTGEIELPAAFTFNNVTEGQRLQYHKIFDVFKDASLEMPDDISFGMNTISYETLSWNDYLSYFDSVLTADNPTAPYDDPQYFDYAKLNQARQNRWLRKDNLLPETVDILSQIKEPLNWTLITEPWCGDAAHIVPIVYQMSQVNPLVQLNIQLRDRHSEIEQYLTNGTKSIPILIIRSAEGKDLAVWGPRPAKAQDTFARLKAEGADFEAQKLALQHWYNEDKTVEIQKEIGKILSSL